ncbi:MAG: T9SS type A sorting domain-containing protein [Ignavibacteriaceae bacterium]
MRKFSLLLSFLLLFMLCQTVTAQDARKELDVPIVDPAAITLDAQMNEAEWQNAAKVDLVTNTGYNIFSFYYGREGLAEPDYDEYYARLLWSQDTLYAFIHIDDVVNDSSGLYWNGQWTGDQLFVSLSNRLGINMEGNYDGNVYAAPNGPYHYLILGDQVTLNRDDTTFVPEEYRKCLDQSDSLQAFHASDYARWAISIDTVSGVWNLEMAIYNPNVTAQSCLGFNLGGSQGARGYDEQQHDSYAYYTWQPNIPNDPFGDPFGNGDPGFYNLANADYWAILKFKSGVTGIKEEYTSSVPTKFTLLQNYPNPFNPSTTIRFEVAKQGPVTLKVYNLVGEVVATLVNGEALAPGVYSTAWDAKGFASGVYIYELRAEGILQSKKMILLK